jgi:dynein heavy chain
MKPREEPIIPDPQARPRKYADENKWIWDLVEDLKAKMNKGLEPL